MKGEEVTQLAMVNSRCVSQEIPELGVRCDHVEMPHPIGRDRADRYFIGTAQLTGTDGPTRGTFALSLTGTTLAVIVAPESDVLPACWLSSPTSDLRVSSDGADGLFGKRPKRVMIDGDTFCLEMTEICEFSPGRRVAHPNRSRRLVSALLHLGATSIS